MDVDISLMLMVRADDLFGRMEIGVGGAITHDNTGDEEAGHKPRQDHPMMREVQREELGPSEIEQDFYDKTHD